MKALASIIAAAMLAGGSSVPAAAQHEGDFEANGAAERVIGGAIDALIGNRYNVSDRQAIRSCGWAAVRRAENQYRGDFRTQPVAYPGYRGHVRVAAITDVQRRFNGVRVKGLLDIARHGYRGGRGGADLTFRCDVSRGGSVTNLRLDRNRWYRPR